MTTVLSPKTTLANDKTPQRWFVVDAEGLILGRMAASIATILMGKHKAIYTAHIDVGDFVVVLNADKVKITGNKLEDMSHDYYTYYPGGHKSVPYGELIKKNPEKLITLAVKRMLPKSKLGVKMLTKMKVYNTSEHPHQAQQVTELDLSVRLSKALAKLSA